MQQTIPKNLLHLSQKLIIQKVIDKETDKTATKRGPLLQQQLLLPLQQRLQQRQ